MFQIQKPALGSSLNFYYHLVLEGLIFSMGSCCWTSDSFFFSSYLAGHGLTSMKSFSSSFYCHRSYYIHI